MSPSQRRIGRGESFAIKAGYRAYRDRRGTHRLRCELAALWSEGMKMQAGWLSDDSSDLKEDMSIKLERVTTLRGVAALMVAVGHSLMVCAVDGLPWPMGRFVRATLGHGIVYHEGLVADVQGNNRGHTLLRE